MVKVTFTLDDATVKSLTEAAARRRIPKSQAVREAIEDYSHKEVRMSDEERERKLAIMRRILASPPTRPQSEVDKELADIRDSRRRGWQRPSDRA